MRDGLTSAVRVVQVVSGNDLILRATSAARVIQFLSNLQLGDQCSAAIASVQAEHSQGTNYQLRREVAVRPSGSDKQTGI